MMTSQTETEIPQWLQAAAEERAKLDEDDENKTDIYAGPDGTFAIWAGPHDPLPVLGIPSLEQARNLLALINLHYDQGFEDGYSQAMINTSPGSKSIN